MAQIKIRLPALEEQQRIAHAICSADGTIATQRDKIAALKTYKMGLMQQLFPVVDEVKA